MELYRMYRIEKITHHNGEPRTDGRYPLRVGRRCELVQLQKGYPMLIEYHPRNGEDYAGVLRTSTVQSITELSDDTVAVATMNSVYTFKKEAGG